MSPSEMNARLCGKLTERDITMFERDQPPRPGGPVSDSPQLLTAALDYATRLGWR